MIKLNRTTEYSLMALRHMSRKKMTHPVSVTSAKEIADYYGLPFEITAKTLQRLKDTGLIKSAHGVHGGYTLARELREVTLADFLKLMEGKNSLVVCTSIRPNATDKPVESLKDDSLCGCEYQGRCDIKHVMKDLNARVLNLLNGIYLNDLADDLPSNLLSKSSSNLIAGGGEP